MTDRYSYYPENHYDPENGHYPDVAAALRYDIGILAPLEEWEVEVTLFFGETTSCRDRDKDGQDGKGKFFCRFGTDCLDVDKYTYYGADEICDGMLNDCYWRTDYWKSINFMQKESDHFKLIGEFRDSNASAIPQDPITFLYWLNQGEQSITTSNHTFNWVVKFPTGESQTGTSLYEHFIKWDGRDSQGNSVLDFGEYYIAEMDLTCTHTETGRSTMQEKNAGFGIWRNMRDPGLCYRVVSATDPGPSNTWRECADQDDDGYFPVNSPRRPNGDCQDHSDFGEYVNPGATEYCNDGVDSNCKNGDNDGCVDCKAKGDPVNIYSGTHFYSKTDLAAPSPSTIAINRNYINMNNDMGPFGRGSKFGYEHTLVNGPDSNLIYTNVTGNGYVMNSTGGGAYENEYLEDVKAYLSPTRKLVFDNGAEYIFNANGRLIEQQAASGYELSISRDTNGVINGLSDSFNYDFIINSTTLTISNTTYHVINSVTGIGGDRVDYSYTSGGYLNTVTWIDGTGQADPYSLTYNYNSEGLIANIVDENGLMRTINTYDDEGRVIAQLAFEGSGISNISYIGNSTTTEQSIFTSPYPQVKTRHVFDELGSVEEEIESDLANTVSYTTSYDRDPVTHLLSKVTNPLGEEVRYTYTTDGLTNSVIDASGNETVMFYNATGINKPTNIQDPLGNETVITYDTSGNALTIKAPGYDDAVTMTYTSLGLLNSVTGLTGETVDYNYNSFGMLTSMVHSLKGTLATYTYNAKGRVTSSTDARDKTYTYTYEDMGRRVSSIGPGGETTVTVYDNRGKVTSIEDARDNVTAYSYHGGELVDLMADRINGLESISYNDGSNAYSDRPYSITDRNGDITTFTYGQVDRYKKVNYVSDGDYDEFTLDALKRLKTAKSVVNSASHTVSYTYTTASHNVAGAINSVSAPEGTVSYEYDKLGRRESLESGTLTVNYTPNSKGLTSNINFTELGTGAFSSFNFDYDDFGRLTDIISLDNSTQTKYIYNDTTHELDEIEHIYNGTSEAIAYKYDTLGMVNSLDRTGMDVLMPAVMNAVYDPQNRMIQFNGTGIQYDNNGNPSSIDGMGLTWNQKNQLTHVSGAAAGPIEYRYDAMGRRVSKIVNSVTTNYLYDGHNLIAELDGDNNNAVKTWYVYAGLDRPLARVDGDTGETLYYHQDLLGSVIALTNSSGAVVTQYNYSPFGHTEVIGTDIDQPFRFTGREWDAETGLYYYRTRYYSPDMRRFISEDPIRFKGGDVNWYAYVGNNPVNFSDPFGLFIAEEMPCGGSAGTVSFGASAEFLGVEVAGSIKLGDNGFQTDISFSGTTSIIGAGVSMCGIEEDRVKEHSNTYNIGVFKHTGFSISDDLSTVCIGVGASPLALPGVNVTRPFDVKPLDNPDEYQWGDYY